MDRRIRTDLAIEQTDIYKSNLPKGVKVDVKKIHDIKIEQVDILDTQAEEIIGKPMGKYITINIPSLAGGGAFDNKVIEYSGEILRTMLPKEGTIFIVGLGNRHITPDNLGPETVKKILATRHIPKEDAKQYGLSVENQIVALSPGVLGQTGIESSEIISAICKEINPTAVIAVDALAAADIERLGTTVQFANTGISPGSGVLNKRKSLNQDTLGVPVISIGIPTVIDGNNFILDYMSDSDNKINDKSDKKFNNMMITPREIDLIIEHGSEFVALMINKSIQEDMSITDIQFLTS